jgi:hypothetical protein
LKRRKEDWAQNLARKESLCERAEALAASTDWDNAVTQVKQIQAEWKTIGPVRKSKSEAVWQRFRTACDRFFERYKHRDQLDLLEKAEPREGVIRSLEALVTEGAASAEAPVDLVNTVQTMRARWQQAPELPRGIQQDLAARYHQALARIVGTWPAAFAGSELDPESARKRMEKLLARVEELVASPAAVAEPVSLSPAEKLAKQWRERLAANTMGGRGPENDDGRWRAVEQEIRNAQSQWARLGPVPSEVAGSLNERFQRAVRRFYDSRRRVS